MSTTVYKCPSTKEVSCNPLFSPKGTTLWWLEVVNTVCSLLMLLVLLERSQEEREKQNSRYLPKVFFCFWKLKLTKLYETGLLEDPFVQNL